MSIANNILRLRKSLNLTQEQLADEVGVTRSTITQWETGRAQPRMGAIERLASALRVSSSEIVAGCDELPNSEYGDARQAEVDYWFNHLNDAGKNMLPRIVRAMAGDGWRDVAPCTDEDEPGSLKLRLKKRRKLAGMTQQEFANLLGVKVATYRTWENGRRTMSLFDACACADLLGCTIDDIVGRARRKETTARPKSMNVMPE